ncbi:unnamed protein product [Orchesella dallaii]|uniref:Odorant receptor n=1 Tax=Orchesella dallaii TaxID=48710 RepID=A0ABP1RLP5_9HEXA
MALIIATQIFLMLTSEKSLESHNPTRFATLVIAGGELFAFLTVCFSATRINQKKVEIMYIMNQMFAYHDYDYTTKLLKSKGIRMSLEHQRTMHVAELQILIVSISSFLFPFLLILGLFHPIEPIHVIIKEWLEFDFTIANLNIGHFLIIPFLMASFLMAGNTCLQFALLPCCYFAISNSSIKNVTPIQLDKMSNPRHCTIQTQTYGVMEDTEVILFYRIQQLFNLLYNDIMASLLISSNFVACIIITSVFTFFTIKCQNVLEETGVVGYSLVFGIILVCLAAIYVESSMLGRIVGFSNDFIRIGKNTAGRKTAFAKGVRSCTTLYLEHAYPFFRIDKRTFLEFADHAVDKTIILLLR